MSFPREERMDELVGDRTYVDGIQWRVFTDPSGELPGRNVLVLLGGHWTLLAGADFRAAAERILRRL